MDRVIERCAGLDVHKKAVAACVRVAGQQHVRTFGTMAPDLLVLRDWLRAHGVTHVAMESTGVYWKPIFYVLEDAFTCVLANAAQIAQVPGRKTDLKAACGSPSCWSMGSSGLASCPRRPSANCATSRAIAGP